MEQKSMAIIYGQLVQNDGGGKTDALQATGSFDMDGTLTDSMTVVWEGAPDALLRRYGRTRKIRHPRSAAEHGDGGGREHLIRQLRPAPDQWRTTMSVMREVITELYETVELKPGVRGCWLGLKAEVRAHVHLLQHLERTVPQPCSPVWASMNISTSMWSAQGRSKEQGRMYFPNP
ncbi:MAG: hypothetical protein ACLVJH_04535 [Faecalibacterium prausnitzii]